MGEKAGGQAALPDLEATKLDLFTVNVEGLSIWPAKLHSKAAHGLEGGLPPL
jgi:hypothetical protein